MTTSASAIAPTPRPSRIVLWSIAVAAVIVGVPVAWWYAHARYPVTTTGDVLKQTVAATSLIAAGLVLWWRRPVSRVGILLVAAGNASYLWMIANSFGSAPKWLFHSLMSFGDLRYAVLFHAILTFPTGRIRDRARAIVIGASYALVIPWDLLTTVTCGPTATHNDGSCKAVPHWLEPLSNATLSDRLATIGSFLGLILVLTTLGMITIAWMRERQRPTKRIIGLVHIASAALLLCLATAISLGIDFDLGTHGAPLISLTPRQLSRLLRVAGWQPQLLTAVALAFLAGVLALRLAYAGVGALVVELGTGERETLRDSLARALADPSLELRYWLPESRAWADADGQLAPLPTTDARAVTILERDGDPVAALVHDPALLDEPELLNAVGTAARLAVDNDQLLAAVRAQLAELRASRQRIVEAADAERRKVERDLHDGAQQRLVTLSLELRMIMDRLPTDVDGATRARLAAVAHEVAETLSELRELAQGVHPSVLTDGGLAAAVEYLAERAPLPVAVHAPPDRYSPSVEIAAYFVVAETLTNIAKHARASEATVEIDQQDGSIVVRVTDDGVGGVALDAGSGLRGLSDRVAAIGGTLDITSPPARGTTVTARIPCA